MRTRRGGNHTLYTAVQEELQSILTKINTLEEQGVSFGNIREETERMLSLPENNHPRYRRDITTYADRTIEYCYSMHMDDLDGVIEHCRRIQTLLGRVGNNA
jgi:hypothetical protein